MADTVAERPYRRAWVHISDQAILDALPVPKDARIVTVRHKVDSGWVELMLESDEFELVPEGGVVPVVSPPFEDGTLTIQETGKSLEFSVFNDSDAMTDFEGTVSDD